MLETRDAQHVDLAFLQSYVSITGPTKIDRVFGSVDERDSISLILRVVFLRSSTM
jgi:hypothetical protein